MLNLLFRELQQCSSFFCAYFKPHDDTLNLLSTCNLQHCLFAVLFAFVPVLFACMRGMEIKKSTQILHGQLLDSIIGSMPI